jgi:hypothetical protein
MLANLLRGFWSELRDLFAPPKSAAAAHLPPPEPPPEADVAPFTVEPVHAPLTVYEDNDSGDNIQEFYFKEAILDKLDACFYHMRRLRKFDWDSYAYFSRVGIPVLPSTALAPNKELPAWFRQVRPARGAMFMFDTQSIKREDGIYPRFVYFNKFSPLKAPPHWQRVNHGDVYELCAYWDEGEQDKVFKRGGFGNSMPVHVDDDGTIAPLRVMTSDSMRVRTKHGPDRGRTFTIRQKSWHYPRFAVDWANDAIKPEDRDIQHLTRHMMCLVAGFHEASQASIIRVGVQQGGITVTFAVNIKRTPYFFKDRDVVLNARGSKARIFHIVRPHMRANGSVVHLHFRGLKQFVWNGYSVRITVPGRDHAILGLFDAQSHHYEPQEVIPGNMLDSRQTGHFIAEHIAGRDVDLGKIEDRK